MVTLKTFVAAMLICLPQFETTDNVTATPTLLNITPSVARTSSAPLVVTTTIVPSLSSSVASASSSASLLVLTNINNTVTPVTTSQASTVIFLTCGSKTCAMYESCFNGSECRCPSYNNATTIEVCGSNGKTFKSYEELQMRSCHDRSNVTKVSDGACKEVSEEKKSSKKTLIIVVVVVIILLIVVAIAAVLYVRNKNQGSASVTKSDKSGDQLL